MESNKSHRSGNSPVSGALMLGILFIAAGVLLFGFNMGWLDAAWHPILFSWQMLLIVLGLRQFCNRNVISGIVLVMIGAFFILPRIENAFPDLLNLGGLSFDQLLFPMLLSIAGVFMLLKALRHRKSHKWTSTQYYKNDKAAGWLEKNAIFGGTREIVLDPVFQGGEINVAFGGADIDLRKTTLPEGETVLEANVMFGGFAVYVPADWYVEMRVSNFFGGYEDKRPAQEPTDRSRKLIIKGSCFFGGGEVK